MLYDHFSEISGKDWRWNNFRPAEIACRGSAEILVDPIALDALQAARNECGRPFQILSAYRSPRHNAYVGGAPLSAHKSGIAFDIHLDGHDRQTLLDICRGAGFGSFGRYVSFLHVDMRPGRAWFGSNKARETWNF